MNVEILDENIDLSLFEGGMWQNLDEPINGTDARRRLENKKEDIRLMKETQEFYFD